MDKIKILVTCHKPGPVYQDEVYTPIHVGRAISSYKDEMADMIGDDTGENISEKNPRYCELTAQYWAWKNLKDVEYIGFCHYRRFFGIEINKDNINSLLSKTDVIAIKMPLRTTVYQDIVNFVSPEDLTIFLMVLSQKYPEYEKAVIDFLWGNEFYSRNMLICKKELFDQYAQWIFGLLSECEEYVRRSPYSRGQRAFAYLGEYFMSVFMICHGCRIKTVGFVSDVSQIGQKRGNRFVSLVRSLIKKTFIRGYVALIGKPNCLEDCFSPPVLVGLANDGIAPLGEKSYELASQKDHS